MGMILASALIMPFRYGTLSEYEIEMQARSMGMMYAEDIRATEGITPAQTDKIEDEIDANETSTEEKKTEGNGEEN